MRQHLFLHRADGGIAILLLGDRISRSQILLEQLEHFLLDRRIVDDLQLARFLGCLLGELDDRLDDRLEMPVAEHHGAQHHVFRQFLGFGLDHQHGVGGAGDHEIEFAVGHLVDQRIQHIFAVDEADACGADRAHEGDAGQRQRGGGGNQRENVGIVLHVVRERGDDDLGLVAPAIGKQRTDRTIDQAADQRLLFGRTAFTLEIAAGNAAGCIILFLVVDGQRQEIHALARRSWPRPRSRARWFRHRWRQRRHRPGARPCRSRG